MSKNYVKEYKGYDVPEGADSFGARNDYYPQDLFYRNHGGEVFIVDEWRETRSRRGDLVSLPEESAQEWVDGLPPLNSEVLLSDEEGHLFSSASNEKVSIAEDEVLVVVSIGARYDNGNPVVTLMAKDSKNLQGFVTVNPEFLEPVKTQEQKDREAFNEWAKSELSYRLEEMSFAFEVIEQLANNGAKAPEGE